MGCVAGVRRRPGHVGRGGAGMSAPLLSGYNPAVVVRLPLPRITEPATGSARSTMMRLTSHGLAWLRALYTHAKRERLAYRLERALGLSHDLLRKIHAADGIIIQRRTAAALNRLYARLDGGTCVRAAVRA